MASPIDPPTPEPGQLPISAGEILAFPERIEAELNGEYRDIGLYTLANTDPDVVRDAIVKDRVSGNYLNSPIDEPYFRLSTSIGRKVPRIVGTLTAALALGGGLTYLVGAAKYEMDESLGTSHSTVFERNSLGIDGRSVPVMTSQNPRTGEVTSDYIAPMIILGGSVLLGLGVGAAISGNATERQVQAMARKELKKRKP